MAKKSKKPSELSFGIGFKVVLALFVFLPVVALLGWYFLSA